MIMKNLNDLTPTPGDDVYESDPELTLDQVRDLTDLAANGLCMLLNAPDSDLDVSDEEYDRLDVVHNNLRTAYKELRRISVRVSV